ncbi:hypothetical protein FGK63_12085 [Ruegeria sediminis]|uniref:Tetratricopeptide repeat protein n=1 Tax=Ruegeria sediminis TaxID=2583820 RepID=A0ABY2WVR8_9RHOB|nr:hypothetical protein [Ruegeria sediminis]TMV06854.1 hypothetical protein FGK63_12085 [Ruegeria sediminis]
MIGRLAASVLLLLAGPATAQEIRVRSGEHAGFTRLVFRVPAGTEWQLTPRPRGARLAVGLENTVFVTDGVHDRLSRGRLGSLRQESPGAALEMAFSCDCAATGFLHDRTMIVVDIAVGTVLDRALDAGAANTPLQGPPPCITDAALGFAAWSDGAPFAEQVATARRGMFLEFDRLDRNQALKLAKTYAYFGFGAEAMQVLAFIDPPPGEAPVVKAIAAAMEGEGRQDGTAFAGMQTCDGDAALWAVLAEARLDGVAETGPIEQAFARLPDHLRGHFGPTLSERMTEAGHLEAARRILRSVARSGFETRADVALAEAGLAAAADDAEADENRLTEVVTSQDASAKAPLALARLIGRRWSERGTMTEAEMELAAGFALEYRRSEIGPMLALAHALALALNLEFDRARDLLARHKAGEPDGEWAKTQDRVAMLLAERADDVTFLSHATGFDAEQVAALSPKTAVTISERMIALGFPSSALSLVDRSSGRYPRQAAMLARARAALAAGRPHLALLELEAEDGAEALRLRAEATSATGEHRAAAELLLEAGEPEAAARHLWLAEAWEEAAEIASGRYGTVSRLSRDLAAEPERSPATPLADAGNLLADSGRVRETIAELLGALAQETPPADGS